MHDAAGQGKAAGLATAVRFVLESGESVSKRPDRVTRRHAVRSVAVGGKQAGHYPGRAHTASAVQAEQSPRLNEQVWSPVRL